MSLKVGNVEFGLLGRLDVRSAGVPIVLGGAVRRRLLAILLLQANSVVRADRLVDLLWGDSPPATASNVLQVHVGGLRRVLGQAEPMVHESRISTAGNGYVVRVEPDELDVAMFERGLADARRIAIHAPRRALVQLDRALGLWRGDVLADVDVPNDLAGVVTRLDAERDAASELQLELRIDLDDAASAVPDLQALVAADPTRERWLALLMLALYRSDRQADALSAYRAGRRRLIDELGLDPGPELEALQAAILRHDPSLEAPPHAALPSAALEARTTTIGHHLPAEPNTFVGRDGDIAGVTALVEGGARLVTITGLGGSGKSRLAAHLGQLLEPHFEDGARWVDLAPLTSAEQIPEAIAIAVGVREQPGRPLFESLIGAIGDQRLLLIVDNCEPLLWHAAHALEAILEACPQIAVLTTSREPMRLAIETTWPLAGLNEPDGASGADAPTPMALRTNEAIALFLDRGRAANPRRQVEDGELIDVAAVVRRVDGLPLAIEMAAAWLRAMSPAEIAQRLASRGPLLGLVSGAGRVRHRTLQATFDSSFDLLDPPEQRILRHLSVFAGAVTAGAIERVAGPGVPDAPGSLAILVDRSLVVAVPSVGATRYRLLETIREYGRLKLHEAGEQQAATRSHVVWCLGVAEDAYRRRVADEAGAIRALTAELDELRLALDRATGEHDDIGPRIAGQLAWYWAATGRVDEGRRRSEAALQEVTATGDRARLLVGLGATATYLGDPTTAVATLNEAVRIWRAAGEEEEECLALSALGWAHFWPGENDRALETFLAGAAIAESIGSEELRLRLLAGECQVLVAMGDATRALPLARYLVDAAPPADLRTAHLAHHFVADSSLLIADCRTAAREYAQALELAVELDDQLEIMVEIQGVAMAQAGLGRSREAVLLAGAADQRLAQLGLVTTVPFWLALLDRWIGGAMATLPEATAVWTEGAQLGLGPALELARSLPL